jgi:putative flippase GtrA
LTVAPSSRCGALTLRWRQRLRRLLIGTSLAALAATAGDFVVYELTVRRLGADPGVGTALGCVAGGGVNYVINRVWTFRSRERRVAQILRYTGVSLSGLALSSGIVHLWAAHTTRNPTLVWLVVKLCVSWGWHLPLQRFYVFGRRPP